MRPYREKITFTFPTIDENYLGTDTQKKSQAFFPQGMKNMRKGDYVAAADNFTAATEKEGWKNVEAYQTNAEGKLSIADLTNQIDSSVPTNGADFKSADAYRWRGLAYLAQRKLDQAIFDLKYAIKVSRSSISIHKCELEAAGDLARAYGYRGMVRLTRQDYEGAFTDFSEARKIDEKIFLKYIEIALNKLRDFDSYSAFVFARKTVESKYPDDKHRRKIVTILTTEILRIYKHAEKLFGNARTYLGMNLVNIRKSLNICTSIYEIDEGLLFLLYSKSDFLIRFRKVLGTIHKISELRSFPAKIKRAFGRESEATKAMLQAVIFQKSKILLIEGAGQLEERKIDDAFNTFFYAMKNVSLEKELDTFRRYFQLAIKELNELHQLARIKTKVETLQRSGINKENLTLTALMLKELDLKKRKDKKKGSTERHLNQGKSGVFDRRV